MIQTLEQKQERFTRCVPQLMDFIHSKGFEIRLGGKPCEPKVFGKHGVAMSSGSHKSAHKNGLAINLYLFRNGKPITTLKDCLQVGEYWKTLFSDCKWGGDFAEPDTSYYSIEHDGII